ncbi:hypothetical protein Landi51_04703 [Colletotrichum acutatum]
MCGIKQIVDQCRTCYGIISKEEIPTICHKRTWTLPETFGYAKAYCPDQGRVYLDKKPRINQCPRSESSLGTCSLSHGLDQIRSTSPWQNASVLNLPAEKESKSVAEKVKGFFGKCLSKVIPGVGRSSQSSSPWAALDQWEDICGDEDTNDKKKKKKKAASIPTVTRVGQLPLSEESDLASKDRMQRKSPALPDKALRRLCETRMRDANRAQSSVFAPNCNRRTLMIQVHYNLMAQAWSCDLQPKATTHDQNCASSRKLFA